MVNDFSPDEIDQAPNDAIREHSRAGATPRCGSPVFDTRDGRDPDEKALVVGRARSRVIAMVRSVEPRSSETT